jgi:hypothetical protein
VPLHTAEVAHEEGQRRRRAALPRLVVSRGVLCFLP